MTMSDSDHAKDKIDHDTEMPMPTPAVGHTDQNVSPQTRPPTVGLQVAQLVVIPAVIVVACIIMAVLFGVLAGAKDSIDTHLLTLRQSSGAGKLAMGLQDPRYKDRGLAAYNIATMIPKVTDPQKRQEISSTLIEILDEHTADDEHLLQSYLLLAIGQLGQFDSGGLDAIVDRLDAPHAHVRQGAIGAILSWPDRDEASSTLTILLKCLEDKVSTVRAAAAAAIGQLAQAGDSHTIAALQGAMESSIGLTMRDAKWNAAVALARLGDPGGSQFVESVLLNREVLEQMGAEESGPHFEATVTTTMVNRIMLATLASAADMKGPAIWNKINYIADNDPNRSVRNAAKQLVLNRE